ncbi:MAG: hypothetical protein HDS35_04635 [Bacteroides sp.]|nr:hypothetical protein [Bacteroides sp.]
MAKRIVTKIGNIFCTKIDDKWKVYFQYICNDLTDLNSSVIRVFRTRYPIDEKVNLEEVVKDEVWFYAHTMLRAGIADGVWEKVGKSSNLGLDGLDKVWFTITHDSGYDQKTRRIFDVDPDKNWIIWKVNEEMIKVGRLSKEIIPYIEDGTVFHYSSVDERIHLGYIICSDLIYKYQKRIPLPDVDSYTMIEEDGIKIWCHYLGEYVVQEVVEKDGNFIRLSEKEPEAEGWHLDKREFWQTNWKYYEFTTKEEFDKVWNTDATTDTDADADADTDTVSDTANTNSDK